MADASAFFSAEESSDFDSLGQSPATQAAPADNGPRPGSVPAQCCATHLTEFQVAG